MPQPFKHKPGSSLQQKGALEARPKCAIQIACIAAAWTEIEEQIALIFWTLTGRSRRIGIPAGGGKLFTSSPNPTANAIMDAIESIRVKTAVINAVMKVNAPTLLDEFEILQKAIKKAAISRNTVVHGSWHASTQYPNEAILINGKDRWRYTEKDLREIVSRIHALSGQMAAFHFRCLEVVAKEPPEISP